MKKLVTLTLALLCGTASHADTTQPEGLSVKFALENGVTTIEKSVAIINTLSIGDPGTPYAKAQNTTDLGGFSFTGKPLSTDDLNKNISTLNVMEYAHLVTASLNNVFLEHSKVHVCYYDLDHNTLDWKNISCRTINLESSYKNYVITLGKLGVTSVTHS